MSQPLTRIQLRRGTAAAWTSANPVLGAGEQGLETDTGKVKIGNGSNAWVDLTYEVSRAELGTKANASTVAGKQDKATLGADVAAAPEVRAAFPSLSKRGQQTLDTQNEGALVAFHAALASAATAPVNIAFRGHSMVEGYSATKYANRFADSTITSLRRRMGIAGGVGYKKARIAFAASDWPITNTGTILEVGDGGFGGGGGVHLGTGYVTQQAVAVPAGHTSVDIVWAREPGAGSFSWAVDAGGATTVSTAGTKNRWQTTRVTVDPGAAHTVTLLPVSGFSRVIGAILYAGDENNGIRGFEGGNPSKTSGDLLATDTGANAAWLDAVTATQPQLLVITLLCNDYMSINQQAGTNRIPAATTKTNIKGVVDAFTAKCTNRPSVVLCVENQRNNIDAQLTPNKWADYVDAAYQLADAEGYAVFDWWQRIGSVPGTAGAASGLLHTDGIHPSDKGQRHWGEGLAGFLMPR